MVKTLPDPAALEDNTATAVETLLLGRVDGKKIYLDLDTRLGGIRSWNFKRMFDEEIAEVCLVMPHLLPRAADILTPAGPTRNWRSCGFSQPIKGVHATSYWLRLRSRCKRFDPRP